MNNNGNNNQTSQKQRNRFYKSLQSQEMKFPQIFQTQRKQSHLGSVQHSIKRSHDSFNKDSKWTINRKYIETYHRHNSSKQKSKDPLCSSTKKLSTSIAEINNKLNTQQFKSKKRYYLTQLNESGQDSRQQDICKSKIKNINDKNQNHDKNEINKLIEKSNNFIDALKKNKKKLIRIKFRNASEQFQLPKINCNDHMLSYLTKKQLRSVKAINGQIDQKMIKNYISQSCEKDKFKIEEKSRRFLMEKVKNDYHNYSELQSHKCALLKNNIQHQLQIKKSKFDTELTNRKSSAFLSFLSLSNKQKSNILDRKYMKCNKIQAF